MLIRSSTYDINDKYYNIFLCGSRRVNFSVYTVKYVPHLYYHDKFCCDCMSCCSLPRISLFHSLSHSHTQSFSLISTHCRYIYHYTHSLYSSHSVCTLPIPFTRAYYIYTLYMYILLLHLVTR